MTVVWTECERPREALQQSGYKSQCRYCAAGCTRSRAAQYKGDTAGGRARPSAWSRWPTATALSKGLVSRPHSACTTLSTPPGISFSSASHAQLYASRGRAAVAKYRAASIRAALAVSGSSADRPLHTSTVSHSQSHSLRSSLWFNVFHCAALIHCTLFTVVHCALSPSLRSLSLIHCAFTVLLAFTALFLAFTALSLLRRTLSCTAPLQAASDKVLHIPSS